MTVTVQNHTMKTRLLAPLCCTALIVSALGAFAWSGPLSVPTFTSPLNCPRAVTDQVSAALNRRDAAFVEGRFFGVQQNSMSYRGDTRALNGMLADLAACPGMLLTVGFTTNLAAGADWSVSSQFSPSNFRFRAAVNTSSPLLTVAFTTNLAAGADWSVGPQFSADNFLFRVVVNTSSPRVKLPELVIPAVQGAVLPQASPRFKARITCFNGKLDSGSSCSGTSFQPDGTLHAKGGPLTCGYPGRVSEIEWAFVERRGANDVYRFTRRFPSDTATVTTTSKEVEFSDRRVIVFEDEFQVVVIEPPKK